MGIQGTLYLRNCVLLVRLFTRRIVATGFEAGAPDSISVDDACSLSASSTALALVGNQSQLAIATLGQVSKRIYNTFDTLTYSGETLLIRKASSSCHYRISLMKQRVCAP